MPDSPSACAQCPRAQGRTCCEPSGDERLATLTDGDIERIQAATGLAVRRFVDEEAFGPEAALAYEQLRPANTHAIRHGARKHLRVVGDACVFHRAGSGCSLGNPVRPLLCRLYPFEIDELGSLRVETGGPCHAVDHTADADALFRALQTDEGTLRGLHAQLLTESKGD